MISDFERFEQFIDEGQRPTLRASEFLRELVLQVNLSMLLDGNGSPEGVVSAEPKKLYMDNNGTTGAILYIKKTGSGNTGWLLV